MKKARDEAEIEAVRREILEGALDIIVQEGLDSLTMRKLGDRIGMTAPNIYNYYAGKDALYISIVLEGFEMLHQVLETAYHANQDAAQRARAMIQAYIEFGITHPRYYDIMFTRPTPKYNDYIGTPHEELSRAEYQVSMQIADLAQKAAEELIHTEIDADQGKRRVVQIWSLLHGMVTLYNSRVVDYVAPDPKAMYTEIVDELLGWVAAG